MSKIEITLVIDDKTWAAWQFTQSNTPQLRERIVESVRLALEKLGGDETKIDANEATISNLAVERHTDRLLLKRHNLPIK